MHEIALLATEQYAKKASFISKKAQNFAIVDEDFSQCSELSHKMNRRIDEVNVDESLFRQCQQSAYERWIPK